MRRSILWRTPILCGIALIALPSLLVYGNALHRLVAGVPMYSHTALRGVQRPTPQPELSRRSVLSGAFERAYAHVFGRHFPLLAAAVKVKGQIYWSVLHQSPSWFITIGRHDVLYENAYLDEYCSRNLDALAPRAESWASAMMRMQRWYAAHDKVFIYLLTPSKASIEPENIPTGWPCPASRRDRVGTHEIYAEILRRAGVNLVDAVESTARAKSSYDFPPFPQGGTHFNDLMAAIAARDLVREVARSGSWRRLDEFSFDWRLAAPHDVDHDLIDLLDVPYTGLNDRTPEVHVRREPNKPCVEIPLAEVGGSFTYQVNKILAMTSCPPRIELYEYFHNRMALYPGDRRFPVDEARRAWTLLDAAQVVVLEENEQTAPGSQHGQALYDLVSQRIENDRDLSRVGVKSGKPRGLAP